MFGDLILSEPLYFETELEGELKAAEVHVDSCIQAQLAPAPAAPGSGKMLFPKSLWKSTGRLALGDTERCREQPGKHASILTPLITLIREGILPPISSYTSYF